MKKKICLSWTLVITAVLLGAGMFYLLYRNIRTIKDQTCRLSQAETRTAVLNDSLRILHDSIIRLNDSLYDAQFFLLRYDGNAMRYLEKFHGERPGWEYFIRRKLLQTNPPKGSNPLIPFDGINGPLRFHNVRVLNHKWIIADFSDGRNWGQMLLEYEPVGRDSVRFGVIRALVYPPEPAE